VETIDGGPLASAFAMNKGKAMLDSDFVPGFPLRHAAKDAALATDAARDTGLEIPLTDALLHRWQEAIALGHGPDDVASAVTASAGRTSPATAA
jgi:3-hydroxyisobutyrate dehydrogenase